MFRIFKHTFFLITIFVFQTNFVKSQTVFEVEYIGVPDSVKPSLEYTFSLLDSYITTTVPIKVEVSWVSLDSKVLAGATPSAFYFNYDTDLFIENIAYPKALVEKILGKNLDNEPDISVKINQDFSWYLGTDLNCPPDKYDLISFVFHELIHGLGFTGGFVKADGENKVVLDNGFSVPTIFDYFVKVPSGESLVDLYYSISSDSLYTIITSDSLFWNGSYGKMVNSDTLPKMFAPEFFDKGSSIYHVDETTYPLGTINAFMTPKFDIVTKEIFREPGPIVLGILADIGWVDYFIYHSQPANIETIDTIVTISAIFDTLFVSNSQKLHYSFDGFKNELVLDMLNGSENVWKADIPSIPFERNVQYYFSAESISLDTLIAPIGAPKNVYSIFIGEDLIPPVINHDKIAIIYEDADSIFFTALVTDNLGIDSVYVVYEYNSTLEIDIDTVILNYDGTYYSGALSSDSIKLQDGAILTYYIHAQDLSKNKNSINTEEFTVIISAIGVSRESYATNFDNDTVVNDFELNNFSIHLEDGFSTKSLQTVHPYPSPMVEPGFIDLTATLKYPIKLRNSMAYLTFDEVVLVEPGEINTVFGQHGFWDYVIVEGSKNKVNWYAFEKDGYDSSEENDWLNVYYSNIVSENRSSSRALGTETLYRSRQINLLGNKYLKRGDEVYIRFRLYSDPFTNAWGWAIDNLDIQNPDLVESGLNENAEYDVHVYPSLFDTYLIVSGAESGSFYQITDIYGTLIKTGEIYTENDEILLSELPSGMYTLKILSSNKISIKKIVKR